MKQLSAILYTFSAAIALTFAGAVRGQALPPAVAAASQSAKEDAATRSRDLARLFNDIWQDKLKHEPEYATYLGDKRYDAELTDYSPRAVNDALARGRTFIERLS